jgi:hypothetical protein
MTSATFTDRPAWKFAALAAFAAVCAWLLQRNLGLYPNIFADEWYYSKMSRLQEFKDALVPSYLYLWIYRGTNACGTAFYDCAHVANVVFFAAAAPFVYMIARQVAGKPVAAFLALLSIAAPINVYTAYFMPEAMYYFGFCVLSWLALTRTHWHWAAYGAATGLALGLLSLVKVHALFLVPALCLFLPYVRWAAGGRWVATGLGSLGVALACIVAVKFGLGYLLAGDVALSLFGNFYQGAVNVAGNQRFLGLIDPALINGRGHLMALVLLLPLPLALIAQSVLQPPVREQAGKTALLQLYALLMLGAAAGVTVLYTASIAPLGVNHEGLRLHQRYYDFVFPLLWLVAASAALRYVPPAERAQLTVAGSNTQDLMRAQFRIDDKDTSMVVLDGNPVIEQSQIPVRQKWLLLLGKYQLPAGIKPVVETNEFSLVRVNLAHRRVAGASFARPFGEGLITAAEGLSHIEPWGRWSDAKQVVLHFSRPLPRHARIVLKAQAYDLNTELPFTMHVGGHSEHFRLGWLPQEIGLVFDTDGKQRELAIDVPQPVQPSTRGQPDTRAIGIGLSDIEIGVIDQPDVAVK